MADQATWYLRVWRGDAAGGELVDYTVAAGEGEVVLDVLQLGSHQDGDGRVAGRWNHRRFVKQIHPGITSASWLEAAW